MKSRNWLFIGLAALSLLVVIGLFLSRDALPSGSGTPTPAPAAQLDPAVVIAGFSPADLDQSFAGLERLLLTSSMHAETVTAAALQLQNPVTDVRFAAIYLLANLDSSQVTPALRDRQQPLRTLAAASLIRQGEPAAIPVLIEALSSKETLPYYDPPLPMWVLAQQVLPAHTDADFGLSAAGDAESVAGAAGQWDAWWQAHSDTLQWEAGQQRFF